MKTKKLTDGNFLRIVIGQIISLFGNGILRFALPLYILQETGSSAIFGMVSALSFLPLILIMPLGGIISDRVNKRNMMVILDFLTGLLMIIFLLCLEIIHIVPLLVVTLMLLYSISGLYQPVVQASIPILLDESALVKGNSIISSVSALSNLLSPIFCGFLFGLYGIVPIVSVSIFCFTASAILELFIQIPHHKCMTKQGIFSILQSDLSMSFHFIFREKKVLSKMIWTVCILNTFISALILVALPILVTQQLRLSSELYGAATGMLALGGLFGGILTGICKPQIETLYQWFWRLSLALVPLAAAPLFATIPMFSFVLILVSVFMVMALASVISILIMTYVQNSTSEQIVGKVMALLMTLSLCTQPVGQALYGFLFEYGHGYGSIIIGAANLICAAMVSYIKTTLSAQF